MKNSYNKILAIAVALLLVTNIALVIFMMQGRKKGTGKEAKNDPSEMMVKELNMTDQQQVEYKQLKEEHMKKIRPLFDSVRAAKLAFFGLMKDANASDSLVEAYSQRIYERQAIADKTTFAHFKKVRNLFTPEQQPRFDSFLQKMMQRGRRDSVIRKKQDQ